MAPPPKHPTEPEPVQFNEKSPLNDGMTAAAGSAGFGTLVSAIQNSTSNHHQGGLGVFTRTGSTIALFTAVGGVFSFTQAAVSNARHTDDPLNGAAGGCAAGFVVGARAGSIPMMFGSCLALGALVGTFEAAGHSLRGAYPHASPLTAGSAHVEGHQEEGAGTGERGWREERERRRERFFKPKKDTATEE